MNVYFLQIPGYPQVPGNVSENIVKEKPFQELAQLKLHQYLPEGLAFRGQKLECVASPDHRPHQSLVSPLILWHLLFRSCQNHHSVGSASRELWWPSNQVADGRDGSGVFQQGTLPGSARSGCRAPAMQKFLRWDIQRLPNTPASPFIGNETKAAARFRVEWTAREAGGEAECSGCQVGIARTP